jgi:hypothetical protein
MASSHVKVIINNEQDNSKTFAKISEKSIKTFETTKIGEN